MKNCIKKLVIGATTAFVATSLFAQQFTVAVIGDTQNYCDYRYQKTSNPPFPYDQADYFYHQMEYLVKNSQKNGGNIAFALHMGDVVQNYGNYESEWQVADKAFSILDGKIPYAVVPGNHDYDVSRKSADGKYSISDGGKTWNKYFGPKSVHFKNQKSYGGSFNNGMNTWSIFNVDDWKILVIGMEIEPDDKAIDWAQKVINDHKGFPTIVMSHEYLGYEYDPERPGTAKRLADGYRHDWKDSNCAEQLWNKFISKNDQIFLVLCGHNWSFDRTGEEAENARTDENANGNKVYQLLSCYQGRCSIQKYLGVFDGQMHGGDGWLRLMDFDLDKNEIHCRTYSTELYRYENDANSDFIIKMDFDWNKRFNSAK